MMQNNEAIHIILLGAPGCGKGTQAQALVKELNFAHLSTGNLFREKYAMQNEATRAGKASIDKGGFFSTEIAYQMITDFLQEHKHTKGIIYDGFPRNMEQAIYFTKHIYKKPLVIELAVDEEKLTKRLLLRGEQKHREDDSSHAIIQKRMKLYKELTYPLLDFFNKKGLLQTVDGDRNIEKITTDIMTIIRSHPQV